MLKIAVLIFAIGAVGGLIMAMRVLRGQLAPWALSLLHAALGATGLVLTAIVAFGGSGAGGVWSSRRSGASTSPRSICGSRSLRAPSSSSMPGSR